MLSFQILVYGIKFYFHTIGPSSRYGINMAIRLTLGCIITDGPGN